MTVPRISGSVTGDLEAGFVVIVVEALGDDLVTFSTEVRNTVTLHRSGVSAVFTNGNNLDTGFGDINYHIEVNVGLVITPAGIKDIIHFDGVGLGYNGQVVLGGDNRSKAVLFSLTVDVTSFAGDFIDQEGGTCGDGDGLITVGAVDGDGVGDGGTTLDDVFHIVDGNNLHFRPAAVKNFFRLFLTFF